MLWIIAVLLLVLRARGKCLAERKTAIAGLPMSYGRDDFKRVD